MVACDKDDKDKAAPVISDVELGTNNSKTGYIGSDLHVEATVVAENTIKTIEILIHQEGEGEEKSGQTSDSWELDTVYTEFSGLKNTTFHKHVDIDLSATAGDYHFHFIVTDMSGYQTLYEEDLTIAEPTDETTPVITINTAPESGATYTTGQTISISGVITEDLAIGGVYVALVKEDQGLEDSEITNSNTIALLHNHDFDDPTSYSFTASIVVGASTDNDITPKSITWEPGNYYIVVKSPSAYGPVAFSGHYPVKISL